MMINKPYFLYIIFIIILFILPNKLLASSDHGVSVFMYHRIGDQKYPSTNATIEQLKSHIFEARKDQYNVLKASEVIQFIKEGKKFERNSIAFTVDDAYESFFLNGWPLFRDNNIPVTLFISSDMIDFSIPGYMSWEQIRQYIKEGGVIGQHTASHMSLPLNASQNVKSDILRSQKRFKNELGFIPDLFAYPYGEASNEVIDVLKELNIKSAFGQHSGPISHDTNVYYMPRFSINENFGDIDRFIFAAAAKPLIIKNLLPLDMLVKNPNSLKVKFELIDKKFSKNLQCFANPSNEWISISLIKDNKNISFEEIYEFKKGRVRLNCTLKYNKNWYWFGYQLLIM